MNWKNVIFGIGIGFLSGYVVKSIVDERSTVSPEKVLNNLKNLLRTKGTISGSWIFMQSEPYTKNELEYTVYKGGISRTIDGELQQLEFIADATTGTVIDIYQL